MAAANESQGLKIAVVAFITLSVILSVTSYFLYTAYSSAEAKREATETKNGELTKGQSQLLTQYEEMKSRIGVRAQDYDPAKEEIGTHFTKLSDRLNNLLNAVNAAVQKFQSQGAAGQELQDAKDKIQNLVTSLRTEPNKTYSSSMDRIAELLENLSLLSTAMSLDYVDLRHHLEAATSVSKAQVDVQTKAADASRADLENEQKKHTDERGILVAKVTDLQTAFDKVTTEKANSEARIRQIQDE
jgi:chromosome segregation ATPase